MIDVVKEPLNVSFYHQWCGYVRVTSLEVQAPFQVHDRISTGPVFNETIGPVTVYREHNWFKGQAK
jgi:hypothetical protein